MPLSYLIHTSPQHSITATDTLFDLHVMGSPPPPISKYSLPEAMQPLWTLQLETAAYVCQSLD